jgi:hypothetical protein
MLTYNVDSFIKNVLAKASSLYKKLKTHKKMIPETER